MTGGRVVVLGDTGRNFGAGMSGGIAYVYDPRDDFDRRVNYDMVAVEALDDEDREFLRMSVERHFEYTESAVARRMLTAWSVEVSRFRKVMPVDYKRVLGAMKEAQAQGLDEAATLARVMENSHG
jgi:glutamate synthase (NADPH/NADH) large chain